MDKIFPNGTQVLVFYKPRGQQNQNSNEDKFIKGKIISSKESDDLSYHGSPWYVQIYTIAGEDGEEYEATYGLPLINSFLFRTVDDQIKLINNNLQNNYNKIDDINKENEKLTETLNSLLLLKEDLDAKKLNSETSGYAKTLKK